MSKEAKEFFKNYKSGLFGEINTCALCKIVSFDPYKMKADVELLHNKELIKSVPVYAPQTSEFIIRMPYKKDDEGFLIFAQHEIDDYTQGGIDEKSDRQFSLDDAIFIGGIKPFTNELPKEHETDLIISKKDNSAKIVLTENGGIILQPAASEKLILDAPGGVDIKGGDITMTGGSITANGEDLNVDDV